MKEICGKKIKHNEVAYWIKTISKKSLHDMEFMIWRKWKWHWNNSWVRKLL